MRILWIFTKYGYLGKAAVSRQQTRESWLGTVNKCSILREIWIGVICTRQNPMLKEARQILVITISFLVVLTFFLSFYALFPIPSLSRPSPSSFPLPSNIAGTSEPHYLATYYSK